MFQSGFLTFQNYSGKFKIKFVGFTFFYNFVKIILNMKKLQFIITIALALGIISCKSEKIIIEGEGSAHEKMELNLSFVSTKTTATESADNISYVWDSNDVVRLVFEQGGSLHTSSATLKSGVGTSNGTFDVVVPNEVDLSQTYKLYGVVNASFASNSTDIVIPQDLVLKSSISDVGKIIPLYFVTENMTGRVVNESLRFVGSALKINIENKTGRAITISDGVSISKPSANWVYTSSSMNFTPASKAFSVSAQDNVKFTYSAQASVAAHQTVTYYTCVYVNTAAAISDNMTISTTVDNETLSSASVHAPSRGNFEVGVCYDLKLSFETNDHFDATFTLPTMPIERLY